MVLCMYSVWVGLYETGEEYRKTVLWTRIGRKSEEKWVMWDTEKRERGKQAKKKKIHLKLEPSFDHIYAFTPEL